MTDLLILALATGILTGVATVLRGGPENSLIGLNVATISAATYLVTLHEGGLSFSKDIAFYLLFPGFLGVIVFTRFMKGVR